MWGRVLRDINRLRVGGITRSLGEGGGVRVNGRDAASSCTRAAEASWVDDTDCIRQGLMLCLMD